MRRVNHLYRLSLRGVFLTTKQSRMPQKAHCPHYSGLLPAALCSQRWLICARNDGAQEENHELIKNTRVAHINVQLSN